MTDWLISQRQIKGVIPEPCFAYGYSFYLCEEHALVSFLCSCYPGWMCVLLRKEKPLCKGPCPTSVSFVQEGICCHCLGKFHALSACAESSVKGEQKRKSLLPFIFRYKGTESGSVAFSKVFCWHPGNQESKPQLGWDPHPLICGIFKERCWSERGIGDFFWGRRGLLASRDCVAAWAVQDVWDVTQDIWRITP